MKDVSTDSRSLSSLVSSRICHDLVNPLGAIGNGLELVKLTGQTDSPEISLISDSIESASARLNFFRIAFGIYSTDQMVSSGHAQSLLQGYFARSRLQVTWHPRDAVPRAEARLALLLVLCAETALPRGGQIALRRGGRHWVLSATGPRLAVDPALWGVLTEGAGPADLSAGIVHFALAAEAAQALGRPIVLDAGAEDLELSF